MFILHWKKHNTVWKNQIVYFIPKLYTSVQFHLEIWQFHRENTLSVKIITSPPFVINWFKSFPIYQRNDQLDAHHLLQLNMGVLSLTEQ